MIKKLFIHVPKSAGMTVRNSELLADKIHHVRDPKELISDEYFHGLKKTMVKVEKLGANPTQAQLGIGHCRWRDIKPSVRNSMDCFAIARNPWDRTVSRYFFAKKLVEHEKKDPVGKFKIDSFEHFLEERFDWGDKEYLWHRAVRGWFPTADYVTDKNGKLKCDIIRFEKLNQDLCGYFSVPKMTGPRNVTGLNKGSYKDLYTDKTIQIVADWYEKDIEMWGYDFDTGAKKNYGRL